MYETSRHICLGLFLFLVPLVSPGYRQLQVHTLVSLWYRQLQVHTLVSLPDWDNREYIRKNRPEFPELQGTWASSGLGEPSGRIPGEPSEARQVALPLSH